MNKFTKRELQKLDNLIIDEWDDTTTHLVIPRDGISVKSLGFNIGDKFTIQLEGYIINQPPNFTLSENWNQGTFPPEEILDVEVLRVMGKMIGVRAIGKETQKVWEGWLPQKGFKVI